MTDMITWLNGVLDKREATARACVTGGRWHYSAGDTVGAWTLYDEHWSIASMTVYDTEAYNYRERMPAVRHPGYIDPDAIGRHAALNDPAQILADVAADRALLDLADQLDQSADCEAGPAAAQLWQTLAAKYATWPGYRPEWGSQ
ncbi:DUF6221 family protein [Verrucosispora sp. WMMC514]|uniref:DUF6221 family protein n=1 Tax=Verrucosispora sp. WMMC514 TaxID=3015156 RepID=UPI00248CFC82|nr:DUF6221 family protein [Verrucosispora sp. WMMC514]WBB94213.1 DUF6221 family protein [Verrucosispora sp. WMMC514]